MPSRLLINWLDIKEKDKSDRKNITIAFIKSNSATALESQKVFL